MRDLLLSGNLVTWTTFAGASKSVADFSVFVLEI